MIDPLLTAVYALTNLLQWPVVVVLLFAVAQSAYFSGELLVEGYERKSQAQAITQLDAIPKAMRKRHGIARFIALRSSDPHADDWLSLDRTEADCAERIDRARRWVRLGPALGLAGTLIPLGPALVALADNDLAALSDRLILAFGTTVLGLLAGGLSQIVAASQERWYRLDLAELRHALEATPQAEAQHAP